LFHSSACHGTDESERPVPSRSIYAMTAGYSARADLNLMQPRESHGRRRASISAGPGAPGDRPSLPLPCRVLGTQARRRDSAMVICGKRGSKSVTRAALPVSRCQRPRLLDGFGPTLICCERKTLLNSWLVLPYIRLSEQAG
jgi:hypothetical protein